MTTQWLQEFPPPEAACRGCGAGLYQRAGRWEDTNGVTVCVKARLEDIGQSQRPDYVFHQPMPAGLAGAPLTL